MTDENGRPEYAPIPDLQPRLDEKREALEARIAAIEAATPPPAAQAEPKTVIEKANAVNARVRPPKPAKASKK
jgi:hypothetical protein